MTYNIPSARDVLGEAPSKAQEEPKGVLDDPEKSKTTVPKTGTVATTQLYTKPDTQTAPMQPVTGYVEQAKDQNEQSRENAVTSTKNINDWAANYSATALNEVQNKNFAKDSRYGNFNNMSADATLKAARNVDAYNNRPVDKLMIGGSAASGTGSYSLGNEVEKYSRPQLSTVESRLNEENMQLDVNQRRLDQDLQSAVNSKNWEAYSQALSQMYGFNENLFSSQMGMNVWKGQQLALNVLDKDAQDFVQALGLHYNEKSARFIKTVLNEDPLMASVLSNALFGYSAPSLTQNLANNMERKLLAIADKYNMSDSAIMAELQRIFNTVAGSQGIELWQFIKDN